MTKSNKVKTLEIANIGRKVGKKMGKMGNKKGFKQAMVNLSDRILNFLKIFI